MSNPIYVSEQRLLIIFMVNLFAFVHAPPTFFYVVVLWLMCERKDTHTIYIYTRIKPQRDLWTSRKYTYMYVSPDKI